MDTKTGVARLRAAIKNQRDAGEGEFRLSFVDVEAICKECEDELARLSWAHGVPVPVDADGKVVPLTTRVMYDRHGCEIALDKFVVRYAGVKKSFVVYAISIDGVSLAPHLLHLHRPDSWEKLEKDVSKTASGDICGYFGAALNKPCSAECPARDVSDSCAVAAVRDVMRRAKALAERDVKEAADAEDD